MAGELLSRYEIDNTIDIFRNDVEFTQIVIIDHGISLDDDQYRELAITLLDEKSHISENVIEDLAAENPPFLRNEISTIYGKAFIEEAVYKQTLYTFKYSTIKTFFRSNYGKFLPDYDFLQIESNEKVKIFFEAFMREFDRFASIIDNVYNIVDVNKIPTEYLNYMAQAIGYEREDSELLTNASFRELIKNIIEIYRIKGTNYSFELFFNFLGFEAELKEFWFDMRYADQNLNNNPETGATDKNYHLFYMSSKKPTTYIPEGMRFPYIISEDKITPTMDVNEFTRLAINNIYTYRQLVGMDEGYPDEPYTFFKTNVIQYSLSSIRTGETQEEELSLEDLATIRRYADFLTPLFVQKNVIVLIKPFEDSGAVIRPKDSDRHDPLSNNPLDNIDETMFHMYEGYQPKSGFDGYYWEHGIRLYDDPIPAPAINTWRWTGNKYLEPGGHFISGVYEDTYDKIYNPLLGSSVFSQIKTIYPSLTIEQITKIISAWNSTSRKVYGDITNGSDWVTGLVDTGIMEISFGDLIHSPAQLDGKYVVEIDISGNRFRMDSVATADAYEKGIELTGINVLFTGNTHYRDLLSPLIDSKDIGTGSGFRYLDDFSVGTAIKLFHSFSSMEGDKKRLTERNSKETDSNAAVKSVVVDNGSGNAVIALIDPARTFAYLDPFYPDQYHSMIETVNGKLTAASDWVTEVTASNLGLVELNQMVKYPAQVDGFKVIEIDIPGNRFRLDAPATTTAFVEIKLSGVFNYICLLYTSPSPRD